MEFIENRPCLICKQATCGMPSNMTFGPRSAQFVQDMKVWICSNPECLDTFNQAVETDDKERVEQRAQFKTGRQPRRMEKPKVEQEEEMEEDVPIKQNLLSFTGAAVNHALDAVWRDGGGLYKNGRELVRRTFWAGIFTGVGAVGGALGGFMFAPKSEEEEDEEVEEREQLLGKVRTATIVRRIAPAVEQYMTGMEYDARRKLEEMGYYPCQECGVPHVKDEEHQMPAGTFWSNEKQAYVKPNDPLWSQEAYEAASEDNRWDLEGENDDDGGEKIH